MSGAVIKSDGKVVLVFGVAQRCADSVFEDAVGIDLDTEEVVSVNYGWYENVGFIDLTTQQQRNLAKYINIRLDLANRVVTISGKARTGKDTVAQLIMDSKDNYIVTPLGYPIKQIAKVIYGDYKGKNRHALIMIGQGLREKDPHIWIKTWLRQALRDIQEDSSIGFIITDVRQPNEFSFFKSLGATTIKIVADEDKRRQKLIEEDGEVALDPKLLNDETEQHSTYFETDYVINNDYTENLVYEVDRILSEIV